MKFKRRFVKKFKYNYKTRFLIPLFVLVCVALGLGYAYLRTDLSIVGVTKLKDNEWNVHFDNIQPVEGSVEPVTAPSISELTTVSFSAQLENPGDKYEFYIDVVNSGTIDAQIGSITMQPELSEDDAKYFNYELNYDSGFPVKVDDVLLAGRTRTIKVSFKYLENADTSNYPDEDKSFNINVTLGYVQSDGIVNPCTSESATSYENGQYVYSYDSSLNGWSVGLKDRSSTDPVTTKLCTSINGQPIVSMAGTFASSNATSIDLSSFNTKNVVTMNAMFAASKVSNLDFSTFDTSKVTDMGSMFVNASNLESLDLSMFDTSNVANMVSFLASCTNLKKANLSGINTSKVTGDAQLLGSDLNLEEIDYSNADFSNYTGTNFKKFLFGNTNYPNVKTVNFSGTIFGATLSGLFVTFSSLEEVNFRGVDTSRVTNLSGMFYGVNGEMALESIDLSDFDTSNVTQFGSIFPSNIKSLNLSNWDFSKYSNSLSSITGNIRSSIESINLSNAIFPADMSSAFYDCSLLENLELSNVDTSNVTDMSHMFDGCSKLTSLDLSSFDLRNVTDMSLMFEGTSIEEINLSGKSTPRLTTLFGFCRHCSNLKKANMDGLGSDNLTSLGDMFYNATAIEEMSFKNFNFGTIDGLGSTQGPFYNKPNLVKVDLSGSIMNKVASFNMAFQGDSSLQTLNLFNITAPTEINISYQMFSGNSSLTTIDLSSFSFASNLSSGGMFSGVTATTGYCKTQADCDILNAVEDKPAGLVFTVKS